MRQSLPCRNLKMSYRCPLLAGINTAANASHRFLPFGYLRVRSLRRRDAARWKHWLNLKSVGAVLAGRKSRVCDGRRAPVERQASRCAAPIFRSLPQKSIGLHCIHGYRVKSNRGIARYLPHYPRLESGNIWQHRLWRKSEKFGGRFWHSNTP